MVSKIPAIPSVPMGVDPALTLYLNAVKSALDVLGSGTSAGAITQEDLDAAIAQVELTGGGGTTTIIQGGSSGGVAPDPPDTTIPDAPTGLTVTGGFSTVILEWDAIPPSPPIAFVTIYRAAVNDYSKAVAVGTCRVLLYADYVPDSHDYYYWITFTSDAGIEGPTNSGSGTTGSSSLDPTYTKEVLADAITDLEIADKALSNGSLQDSTIGSAIIADAAIITAKIATAAIVTAHIQDAAIIDAKIQNLAADKILANSLSAINANLGTVTAGLMQSPDGTFKVDLSGKEILVTGPNGQAADDYTVIREGSIETYEWTGAGHVLSKALRGLAVGIASNGATVTMSGQYFRNQPRIIVSPASIPTYLSANAAQDQTLECIAQNIQHIGNGIWQFEALAQLSLSGSNEIHEPGLIIADSSSNLLTTSEVSTNASTAERLTASISVRSYRQTTTAGTYYNRTCTSYLQYRIAGSGGAWLNGASQVTNFLNEFQQVVVDLATGTLPQEQYEVRIECMYSDRSGTFVGSGGGTTSHQITLQGSDQTINQSGPGAPSGQFSLPSWGPAGAVVTNSSYEYNWTATANADYLFTSGDNTAIVSGTGGATTQFVKAVANSNNPTGPVQVTASGQYTASDANTYNPNKMGWSMSLTQVSGGSTSGQLVMTGLEVLIDYTLPATSPDQNAHNWLTWNTLVATLAGSIVLSNGTLNWLAIGES